MHRYVFRRIGLLILVFFGISVITFVLSHVVPGDPARLLAGPEARPDQIAALRHRYGLDQPWPQQYVIYMTGLLHGDMGMSLTTRRPVSQDIREFLPATIELTVAAMILIIVVGIPLGILSAIWQGTIVDKLIRFTTIAGVSMPVFWLGIVLQIIFFGHLGILPLDGQLDIIDLPPPHATGAYVIDALLAGDISLFTKALLHLVLPAVTLASGAVGMVTLVTRASVLETLDADFVRTARAKGLYERVVLWRHVLRNALIPAVTVLGLEVGWLLGGNVLVETVFNWPGIGLYAVTAIHNLDYAPIMTVTLIITVIYVTVNLVVDVLYIKLDPRITYG